MFLLDPVGFAIPGCPQSNLDLDPGGIVYEWQ
jgi:hypothetical protein